MPISNRLYPKPSLKLKIPTSPESDGEIYLTPNTSVAVDEDRCDSGMEDTSVAQNQYLRNGNGRPSNGYRMDKIQSMSSISNRLTEVAEDQVDSGMEEQYTRTPENGNIYRMKSLGSLSQYERAFGATPKTLLKLKEDFENRRIAMLTRRRSLTNLLAETSDASDAENVMPSNVGEFKMPETSPPNRDGIFFTARANQTNGKYKKRIGVGDTKYIGTDFDTPEQKQYHLTKIKSMGTIPDLLAERTNYDPFWTPTVARRHPASLHSFDGRTRYSPPFDGRSDGSSDMDEQEDFLRHQPDEHVRFMNEMGLLKGSFERGFRRSYNRKHDQNTKTTTPLRQSDGYFQMPSLPVRKTQRHSSGEQKCRSSVHSLPSDGKFDAIRYENHKFCRFTWDKSININCQAGKMSIKS